MKRRRIFLLFALIVVASAVGLVAFWPRGPKEPVHQGKPFRVWIQEAQLLRGGFVGGDIDQISDAHNAVKAIGTNALPWLIYELNRRQPRWAGTANQWAHKLHWEFLRVESESERILRVTDALQVLGSNAVPFLRQAANSPDPIEAGHGAWGVGLLAGTVPEAFDVLYDMLTHTNRHVRNAAALRMTEFKRQRDLSLPILTQMLSSTNPGERLSAAAALGSMYAEAKPAVPALLKLLSDSDPFAAQAARAALLQIDPDALPSRGP